jgi:ribonucleoside-diphosphate reductase alpha chain
MSDNAEDSYEGHVGNGRRKMPKDRKSRTVKIELGGYDFYVTAGEYEDGTLGEIFVKSGKQGSTTQGFIDAFATMFSIGLQYGAEFDMLARKFAHMKFEPFGYTNIEEIPYAFSPIDAIVRWLGLRYGTPELQADLEKIAKKMGA